MAVTIRKYQPNDKKEITKLFEDYLNYFTDIDPLKRSIHPPGANEAYAKRMINETSQKKGVIFVAEEDKQIIGFIAGIIQRQTEDILQLQIPSTPGRVIELYVKPKYRGKNIGKTLMQKMEQYYRGKECDIINIEVFQPNKNAHIFYKKLGYSDRIIDLIKIL